MFGVKFNKYDKMIDKATSSLLIEPDWDLNLAICDAIRGQDVQAKSVISSLKKHIKSENSNEVLRSLNLLEALMKNCGRQVHDEVNNRDFLETMVGILKYDHPLAIKEKVLETIQNWATAFKNNSEYIEIVRMYSDLRNMNYNFPPIKESEAMFSVECAPKWIDGDYCFRCKNAFSTLRRKHHCRNCGNIFCDDCSKSRAPIPKYGIEKEVRVCQSCEITLKNPDMAGMSSGSKPSVRFDDNQQQEKERKQRELELQEEEELQLVLALSASEAESQNKNKGFTQPAAEQQSRRPTTPVVEAPWQNKQLDNFDLDPELAPYLNRAYWEDRQATTRPSAPVLTSPTPSSVVSRTMTNSPQPNPYSAHEAKPIPVDTSDVVVTLPGVPDLLTEKQRELMSAAQKSIDMFNTRLKSTQNRGRAIETDTIVQKLFHVLLKMQADLQWYKSQVESRRSYFEATQDKLTEIKEAREALDVLRHENMIRKRMEEEEAARQRQIQLQQKVDLLRKEKRNKLDQERRMMFEYYGAGGAAGMMPAQAYPGAYPSNMMLVDAYGNPVPQGLPPPGTQLPPGYHLVSTQGPPPPQMQMGPNAGATGYPTMQQAFYPPGASTAFAPPNMPPQQQSTTPPPPMAMPQQTLPQEGQQPPLPSQTNTATAGGVMPREEVNSQHTQPPQQPGAGTGGAGAHNQMTSTTSANNNDTFQMESLQANLPMAPTDVPDEAYLNTGEIPSMPAAPTHDLDQARALPSEMKPKQEPLISFD